MRRCSVVVAIFRVAAFVFLNLGAYFVDQASLLLWIDDRALHLDNTRTLVNNTFVAFRLLTFFDYIVFAVPVRVKWLPGNPGLPVGDAQDTVSEVARRRSAARWGFQVVVVHLFTQGSQSI